MKRISDEEIKEIFWTRNDYSNQERWRAMVQAQLESCEKEEQERVQKIFEEIDGKKHYYALLSPTDGMDCILINREDWRALKQRLGVK